MLTMVVSPYGEVGYAAPGAGMAPICIIKPTRSALSQVSTTWPFARRKMAIPVTRTGRPEAGTPWKVPRCVPTSWCTQATRSPSATSAWTGNRESVKPSRKAPIGGAVAVVVDRLRSVAPRPHWVRSEQVGHQCRADRARP